MATRVTDASLAIRNIKMKIGLVTIPNLIFLYLVLIGLTYLISSLFNLYVPLTAGAPGPLRTPLMLLIYVGLILILFTALGIVGTGQKGFTEFFTNPVIGIIFAILAGAMYWAGTSGILSVAFSIVS